MKLRKVKQISAIIMSAMLSFGVMLPAQAVAGDNVASGGAITVNGNEDKNEGTSGAGLFDKVVGNATSKTESMTPDIFKHDAAKDIESKADDNNIQLLAAGDVTPVSPEGDNPTVKITCSDVIYPMTVNAYQILQESAYETGQTVYTVTDDFAKFFEYASEDYAKLTNKGAFYVYLGTSDDESAESVLRIAPTGGDDAIYVTGLPIEGSAGGTDQSANIDEGFFGASLLEHILTSNANIDKVTDWARSYVEANPEVSASVSETAASGAYNIELEMPKLGYWMLISSGAPTGIANVKTILKLVKDENANISLKHEKQSFDKQVMNVITDKDYGKETTAGVNDRLRYNIDFLLQDLKDYDPHKNYNFALSDKMYNQKLDPDSFEVTFYWTGSDKAYHSATFTGKEEIAKKLLKYSEFIGEYNEEENYQRFVMSFALQKLKNIVCDDDDAKITDLKKYMDLNMYSVEELIVSVTYEAILQDSAEWKNDNEARWDYDNDPKVPTGNNHYKPDDHDDPEDPDQPEYPPTDPDDPDPENPDPEDPDNPNNPEEPVDPDDPNGPLESKTSVYSYGVQIKKDFSDGRTDLYNKVAFTLSDSEGNVISFVPNAKGDYSKAEDADQYGENEIVTKLLLDEETGTLKIYGLRPGNYVLSEVEKPSGYSRVEAVNITIDKDNLYAIDETYSKVDEKGVELEKEFKHYTASSNYEWMTFAVLNQKGFTLPDTGRAGVYLLGIFGVLLLATAAYVYGSLRKKGMI